jgi:glutamate dehydrogenase
MASSPLVLRINGHAQIKKSSAPSSATSSELNLLRVKNTPGYITPEFTGKREQRETVEAEVTAKVCLILFFVVPSRSLTLCRAKKGFIPRELVPNEVNWFYSHLGIDDTYFQNESLEVISDHVIALYGAKVLAYTKRDPTSLVIDLERVDANGNGATFIHTSPPGVTSTEGPGARCESR